MMSMLTQIFVRRYVHRHDLLIVFLSSAIWGVLWVPMRYAESFGISGPLAGTAAFVMGDMFSETHRLIAVLPVAFLASTVVFLPSVLLIFRIMQYVSPGLVGILMLS